MNLVLLLVTILAPLAPLGIGASAAGKQERQPDHESAPAPGLDMQADPYLYEVILLRAAPGRLLDLVEAYQARIAAFEEAALGEVHMMRHSQGDQWDLLLLVPMGDFERFFSGEQTRRRSDALDEVGGTGPVWAARLDPLVAWRQELFAWGPPPEVVNERFAPARFYHIEMFVALPGKREALLRQREMENEFLRAIGRPDNLVFTKAAGAEWDAFTLGFYRDLQHFAEEPSLDPGREDEAARAAGFEAANRIGTYLRTLIAYHHDTLARSVD
jgi:hypothetical protein